jgi:glutathione-regulated potassium-efflux system ancillary protein KefG
MPAKKILINLFHPDLHNSRGNRALLDAVSDLPNVTIRDMFEEYEDCEINAASEQGILKAHDVIIFQHPLFWLSTPALMKKWQDTVLEKGFAFPPGKGTQLEGKLWQSVITTGGAEMVYTKEGPFKATFEEILLPLRLTAEYCSMVWQPVFAVSSVMPTDDEHSRAISEDELQAKADEYRKLLLSF